MHSKVFFMRLFAELRVNRNMHRTLEREGFQGRARSIRLPCASPGRVSTIVTSGSLAHRRALCGNRVTCHAVQDLCGASCADTWQPLASQVPSYFQSWPGMGLKTRSCWEALGWTEVSWKAKSRIPTSSQKSWKQLSPEEQRSARCVGYSRQLWDDLKEDIADSILCRNGSAHFQLPWDCLPGPLMED
ncbi:unnamed protein product, partial [Durusdinium trenchii]